MKVCTDFIAKELFHPFSLWKRQMSKEMKCCQSSPLYGFAIVCCLIVSCGYSVDQNVLMVGKELLRETRTIANGILYLPASRAETLYLIPAMFSLQLKRGKSEVETNRLRKLLNTEKLIFKAEDLDEINSQGGLYVLITVEPEGFVAIPGVQERETILYNIVCDELMLGIPHKAWVVAALALLCVAMGFSIPRFLQPFLMARDQDLRSVGQLATHKDS